MSGEQDQIVMHEEMRRTNRLVADCFKTCIHSMSNKILTKTEKKCIKDYYEKNRAFNEVLLQAFGKTKNAREQQTLLQMTTNTK